MGAVVHLVSLAVAKGRCRIGSVTEGTVEGGGVLGRVGQHTGGESCHAESALDGLYLSVHHGRRCHEVSTSFCVLIRHFGQERQGGVIVHIVMVQESAVSVTGIFAEAYIREDNRLGRSLLDGSYCARDEVVLGIGCCASLIFHLITDNTEEQHLVNAQGLDLQHVVNKRVNAVAVNTRHRGYWLHNALSFHHEIRVDEILNVQTHIGIPIPCGLVCSECSESFHFVGFLNVGQ